MKELPYYGKNITYCHGEFNNLLLDRTLPTKKDLDKLHSLHDMDLFNLNTRHCFDSDQKIRSNYYSPYSFKTLKDLYFITSHNAFSVLHNNVRSLGKNLEKFQTHLLEELDFYFDIIAITETKITKHCLPLSINLNIPGYSFEYVPTPLSSGLCWTVSE